jgi:hypothetical protein
MTENSHLTPLCPDVGVAHEPARDRIVSLAMMRGGAFILLKVGQGRRETANQAEIRLADLPTILSILRFKGRNPCQSRVRVVSVGNFRRIWLIRLELYFLSSSSQS